jgi:hypothetical protein
MKGLIRSLERKVEAFEGTHAVLLVIGALGVVTHLAHLAGVHIPIAPTLENLILLLSLLCIGIGLGQLKLAGMNNKLAEEIRGATHGFVVEPEAIWTTLTLLVGTANVRLRATHLTTIETPDEYLDALTKQLRSGVGYQVIFGYNASETEQARKLAVGRMERFSKSGCDADKCNIKFMGVVWGLDLLIVDERHLFLGFPIAMGERTIKAGVVFWDKPELVSKVCDWYDTHLWEVAHK